MFRGERVHMVEQKCADTRARERFARRETHFDPRPTASDLARYEVFHVALVHNVRFDSQADKAQQKAAR